MTEATFTFRVDEELKSAFSQAAQLEDQTGAQLLRRFMREFVSNQQKKAVHDAWFDAQVLAGITSANAGELLSNDDVEAEAVRWRNEAEPKLANGEF